MRNFMAALSRMLKAMASGLGKGLEYASWGCMYAYREANYWADRGLDAAWRGTVATINTVGGAAYAVAAAPFKVLSAVSAQGNGTSRQPTDENRVAARAAADAMKAQIKVPDLSEDPTLVKRLAGQMAMGKQVSPQCKVSRAIIERLMSLEPAELREVRDAHVDTVAAMVGKWKSTPVDAAEAEADEPAFGRLYMKIAARMAAEGRSADVVDIASRRRAA